MDQYLVAAVALLVFFGFAAGYFIGNNERKSRRPSGEVHSDYTDVEIRSRRPF
jgi:hypothetical protein